MSPSRVPLSDEEEQFLKIGVEYYIAARSAAREGLITMVGILFHHAIEMCLKARLSHQCGVKRLSQKPFGHDLDALWHEFKAQFPQANLNGSTTRSKRSTLSGTSGIPTKLLRKECKSISIGNPPLVSLGLRLLHATKLS